MVLVYLPLVVGVTLPLLGWAHFSERPQDNAPFMSRFTQIPGVMVSFDHAVVVENKFKGFNGWDLINDRYRAMNISYIVRIEFARKGFRESKVRRHFKRYWLPGALWVERSIRNQNILARDLRHLKTRNHSHVDIWVKPECFLRHNGPSRIHRVSKAKTMRLKVTHIRWLAKITYMPEERYGLPELMEISKTLVQEVPGLSCSWIHPRIESSFSLMLRFFGDEINQKSFFSTKSGYSNWDSINNDYQVQAIHFFRGWTRALVDFAGGINCRESIRNIGQRYQSLPSVNFVYLDKKNECRFTYQIIVSFNPEVIGPHDIKHYTFWNELNRFYGAVEVNTQLAHEHKAIIEFEPGMYNNIQMKAIRDEYVKLPSIRFGWVMGKTAIQISTIILNFDKRYVRRAPLRKYNHWDALNRRYMANITVIEEDFARAHIRFPIGAYSDMNLKNILSRYRHLPGISSVRMDTQTYGSPVMEHASKKMMNTNSSSSALELLIPKKRSLFSWLQLSQGDRNVLNTHITIQGLDKSRYGYNMYQRPMYEFETPQEASECINVN